MEETVKAARASPPVYSADETSSMTATPKRQCRQPSASDQRIMLNVGGIRHETHVSTLRNVPNTRLSRLSETHVDASRRDEYFFDRHPAVFNSVIDFYRTGELHVPLDVCGAVVKRELDFWQIDEFQIRACCWRHYRVYIDNQKILEAYNTNLGIEHDDCSLDDLRGWKRFQMKVWMLLDHPRSSRPAMLYGISSFFFVMLSILGFCLETLPSLRPKGVTRLDNTTSKCDGKLQEQMLRWEPNQHLNVIDIICTVFFTLELVSRFTFAPNKLKFVRSTMNIIDMLALVPLYVQFVLNKIDIEYCYLSERLIFEVMFILRIIRMFRIFHLVKHYQALKILVCALRASVQEFLMLSIFLIIGMLIFASMIYYAEREDPMNPSKTFTTIPVGFWWAIITMTTVGYGDVYPKSPLGYVVGAGCAISGVLMVALTIPVISNNFTLFYTHARSRSEIPKGRRIKAADEASLDSQVVRKRKQSGSSVIVEAYANGKGAVHETVTEDTRNSTMVPLYRLSDEFCTADLYPAETQPQSRSSSRICLDNLNESKQGETDL